MTDIEFSCAVIPTAAPTGVRELCLTAESQGFDRFWLPDQEFYADPFLLLSDLARRTTMHLGLALTSPFSRHPMQIARAFATVVHLDEREREWVLGLGMGNSNLVLGPLGLADGATSSRLSDGVGIVRRLLRGETVSADDDGFFTEEVSLDMDPVDCSVYVGTRGPKTLTEASPHADGIITESLFTPEAVAWVRERSGIQAGTPHIAWQSVYFIEDDEPLPESVRNFATMLIRTTTPAVRRMLGLSTEVIERAEQKTLAPEHLSEADVGRLVAIGTPKQIRNRVMLAAEAGVTGWSSVFLGTPHQIQRSMHLFGDGVIATIRASA